MAEKFSQKYCKGLCVANELVTLSVVKIYPKYLNHNVTMMFINILVCYINSMPNTRIFAVSSCDCHDNMLKYIHPRLLQ